MNIVLKIILGIFIFSIIIAVTGFGFLIMLFIPIKPKVKREGIKIACIGDSITFGAGVVFKNRNKTSYPAKLQTKLGDAYQVLNYGNCGCTLLKSGDRPYWNQKIFKYSKENNPDIVLIMLGTNDTKPFNWNSKDYGTQLEEMISIYKAMPNNPRVYLLTPCAAYCIEGKDKVKGDIDVNIIENEVVKIIVAVAFITATSVIDIFHVTKDHPEYFGDGIHPNVVGNEIIAQLIYNTLKNK